MIKVRKSGERGHANHGWLDTYHTFSFADYHDPEYVGFRSLRVINEDRVAPGKGFGTHPHRDMEILTYVLEGALEHRDSMGTGAVIHPGEIQRMSAGRGVTHSEFNASKVAPVHLLQIWILPSRKGIEPSYEQVNLPAEKLGGLYLAASPDAASRNCSVYINQDAKLYISRLAPGKTLSIHLARGRYGWLQMAKGAVSLNGALLNAGDGAAVKDESQLEVVELSRSQGSEFLWFDLA